MGDLGRSIHITVKLFHLWKDNGVINPYSTGHFLWITLSIDLVLSRHVVFRELQWVLRNSCGWRRTLFIWCWSITFSTNSTHNASLRWESLPAPWCISTFSQEIEFSLFPTNYSSHYLFLAPKWKFNFILFYTPALCRCVYLKLSSCEVGAECCG